MTRTALFWQVCIALPYELILQVSDCLLEIGLQLLQKASKILERRGFAKTLKLYPILSVIFTTLWSSSAYEKNFVKLLNMPLAETSEKIHNFYLMEIMISYNEERVTHRKTSTRTIEKKN